MKQILALIILIAIFVMLAGCTASDRITDTVYIGGVDAEGSVVVRGDVDITGDVSVDGDVSVEGAIDTEEINYAYWEEITVGANAMTTLFGEGPNETNFQSGFCYLFTDEALAVDEKYVRFTVELPHSYMQGTDVYINLHWAFNVDEVGTYVRWKVSASWADEGIAFPVGTNIWALSDASNNDHSIHQVTRFASLNGTGKHISSLILCYISRNSSDAADTYTDSAILLGASVLYQVDSPGTLEPWSK